MLYGLETTMMPFKLVSTLLLCVTGIVGCANESSPYTEQTAQIDPAMNPSPPDDQTPSDDAGDQTTPDKSNDKVELTDEQWREVLTEQEFYVLRRSGTEAPGTHPYNEHPLDKKGAFHCVGCGNKLYDAENKFHSGCGWPSFNQEVEPGAITEHRDESLGTVRLEMRCARCDGHLGHIFEDGHLWNQENGLRHCVNGTALIFVPQGKEAKDVIKAHRQKYSDK